MFLFCEAWVLDQGTVGSGLQVPIPTVAPKVAVHGRVSEASTPTWRSKPVCVEREVSLETRHPKGWKKKALENL